MFRVPPDLQQRISPPSEETIDFEKSIVFDEQDSSSGYSVFLSDCGGFFKDLLVVVRGSQLAVFDVFTRQFLCSYRCGKDENIDCVAYHHLLKEDKEEGHPGLLVGVNHINCNDNYVVVLALSKDGVRVLRKAAVSDRIVVVRTLISSFHMEAMSSRLNPRMQTYPHVVVIGTVNGHCYITHLDVAFHVPLEDASELRTLKMTDALRSFHKNERFEYVPPRGKMMTYKPSHVHVTCVGFVDRARALLIGLNFGGIVAVSLSSTPSIEIVHVPQMGSIPRFIEPMIPENDPRPRLYFWVAFDCSQTNAASMVMYHMDFPEDELNLDTRPDPSTWEYKDLAIGTLLAIANADMRRWVSVRCVVDNNKKYHTDLDETASVNTGPSQEHSRTLLSFSYLSRDQETKQLRLMGGLFDLNQHYYKRQTNRVAPDGSVAMQCPFVSFYYDTPCADLEEFQYSDILADPFHISRWSSNVGEELRMDYPSTYKIGKLYVSNSEKMFTMKVDSLPEQVVCRVANNLSVHLSHPKDAAKYLPAIGLPGDLDPMSDRQHQDIDVVLSCIVYHDRTADLCNLLTGNDVTDELIESIDNWLWNELQLQWRKMNETLCQLFNGAQLGLNEAGSKALNACFSLFRSARQIYCSLYTRASALSMDTKLLTIYDMRKNTSVLFEQSLSVHNYLMERKLLPVNEEVRIVLREIRADMPRRRLRAQKERRDLYIDSVLTRLYEYCGQESFWLDRNSKDMYPPTLLDLVSVIPLYDVPSRLKRSLFVYYLLDYSSFYPALLGDNAESSLTPIGRIVSMIGKDLKLTVEEGDVIYEQWTKDTQQQQVENCANQSTLNNSTMVSHGPSVTAREELKKLMDLPVIVFPKDMEDKIKAHLLTLFGRDLSPIYWNCILLKKQRYSDVDTELFIPEHLKDNKQVQQYLVHSAQLRHHREQHAGFYDKVDPKHKLSQEILDNMKKYTSEDASGKFNPPTPQRSFVFKNTGNLNARRQSMAQQSRRRLAFGQHDTSVNTESTTSATRTEASPTVTPKTQNQKTLLNFDDDDDTPRRLNKDLSPNTLNVMREIVRTPKARAKAAVVAEGRLDLDTTPEQQTTTNMMPPASILKSAKKPMTPSRGGIRWDPKVCTPEDVFEIASATTSSAIGINFEDSDEDGESDKSIVVPRSSKTDVSVKTPATSSVSTNGEDDLRGEESARFVEEQEDPDVNDTVGMEEVEEEESIVEDKQEEVEEEKEEVEEKEDEEKVEEDAARVVPLVDYSFSADSEFSSTPFSTPGRGLSENVDSSKMLSHSFEEQDESDIIEMEKEENAVSGTTNTVPPVVHVEEQDEEDCLVADDKNKELLEEEEAENNVSLEIPIPKEVEVVKRKSLEVQEMDKEDGEQTEDSSPVGDVVDPTPSSDTNSLLNEVIVEEETNEVEEIPDKGNTDYDDDEEMSLHMHDTIAAKTPLRVGTVKETFNVSSKPNQTFDVDTPYNANETVCVEDKPNTVEQHITEEVKPLESIFVVENVPENVEEEQEEREEILEETEKQTQNGSEMVVIAHIREEVEEVVEKKNGEEIVVEKKTRKTIEVHSPVSSKDLLSMSTRTPSPMKTPEKKTESTNAAEDVSRRESVLRRSTRKSVSRAGSEPPVSVKKTSNRRKGAELEITSIAEEPTSSDVVPPKRRRTQSSSTTATASASRQSSVSRRTTTSSSQVSVEQSSLFDDDVAMFKENLANKKPLEERLLRRPPAYKKVIKTSTTTKEVKGSAPSSRRRAATVATSVIPEEDTTVKRARRSTSRSRAVSSPVKESGSKMLEVFTPTPKSPARGSKKTPAKDVKISSTTETKSTVRRGRPPKVRVSESEGESKEVKEVEKTPTKRGRKLDLQSSVASTKKETRSPSRSKRANSNTDEIPSSDDVPPRRGRSSSRSRL